MHFFNGICLFFSMVISWYMYGPKGLFLEIMLGLKSMYSLLWLPVFSFYKEQGGFFFSQILYNLPPINFHMLCIEEENGWWYQCYIKVSSIDWYRVYLYYVDGSHFPQLFRNFRQLEKKNENISQKLMTTVLEKSCIISAYIPYFTANTAIQYKIRSKIFLTWMCQFFLLRCVKFFLLGCVSFSNLDVFIFLTWMCQYFLFGYISFSYLDVSVFFTWMCQFFFIGCVSFSNFDVSFSNLTLVVVD
jgi:hypothetical protein